MWMHVHAWTWHYSIAQKFDGRKLQIAALEHFGGENIGGLTALHSS